MENGIDKFKCATIAEAELLGMCGAPDVLLAMQPVGANILRLIELTKAFPATLFSTIVDSEEVVQHVAASAAEQDCRISVYIDLNTGMNRTGIVPGDRAVKLFQMIWDDPNLHAAGLHAYDGHIRNEKLEERKRICDDAFDMVLRLKSKIEEHEMEVQKIIAGGSPTFPIHAKRSGVEASPGTTLLWDERYESLFEDLSFLPAAVLFCRIVSKPAEHLVCLDLGHKSVAPEMDFPRVKLLGLEGCQQIGQSEEHMVLRCPDSSEYQVGDHFYAIPMHICPTVAKYPQLTVVENGEITGSWNVAARNHKITI